MGTFYKSKYRKTVEDCLSFAISKRNYKVHEEQRKQEQKKQRSSVYSFYNDVFLDHSTCRRKNNIQEVEGTHKNLQMEKGCIC